MSLNDSQTRVVAVTLRLFEQQLAEIEEVMSADAQGALYRRVGRFSPSQRERMQALIEELRRGIRTVAEAFRLPCEEQDAARIIMGTLVITWENLEEIRSRRLRAYGAVDPHLRETLDPWIQQFTQLVLEMQEVAVRGGSDG